MEGRAIERPIVQGEPGADARERFGERLRMLCASTGKSYRQLEPDLHVSDSSLSRYATGKSVPAWDVVVRLCRVTGTPPEQLRTAWEQARAEPLPAVPTPSERPPPALAEPGAGRRMRAGVAIGIGMAVAAAAGTWFGATVFTPANAGADRSEPGPCANWQWPTADGEEVEPPAELPAVDHTSTVHLTSGQLDGRQAVWAAVTNARYGDRIWLDISADGGGTWLQCGPFPVTGDRGVSKAATQAKGTLYRACVDVPRQRAGYSRNACTAFW